MITPSADVLVLAGDIGSFYKYEQLYNFIKDIVGYFNHVLYIPGNHEYYLPPGYAPKSHSELLECSNKLDKAFDNFNVLHRRSIQIGDVCIVGATLWSDLQCELPRFIVRINGMDTESYKRQHETDLRYLTAMVGYCKTNKLRMICVTHHPPTYDVMKNASKRAKYISLYASNLDYMLKKEDIDTWICGHVHSNFDFTSTLGSRIIGNQRGKPKDNINDYSKNMVIEY
jgi:predicted phosphohydrolase